MITAPDELREQEMVGMARKYPKLFNELWEKGAYNPANNIPDLSEIWKSFTKTVKKTFGFFRGKKQ